MRHLKEGEINNDYRKFIELSQEEATEALADFYLNPETDSWNARVVRKAVDSIKKDLDGEPVQIYHSGAKRTMLTAETIAKGLGYTGELKVDRYIEHKISLNKYLYNEGTNIIVAHAPSIADIVHQDVGEGDIFKVEEAYRHWHSGYTAIRL